MSNWTHNKVSIYLDGKGKFNATIRGKRKEFISLAAAQKAIDKAAAESVEARTAFVTEYGGSFKEVSIISAKPPRKNSWRPTWEWIYVDAAGREHTTSQIVTDTPDNRAAMSAYVALREKNNALRESMREAEETAYEKIKFTRPEPDGSASE